MSWLISFHCFPFGNHDIAFTSDLLSFHLEFSIKNSFPTPNTRNDLIIINSILLLAQILKLLSHISKLWWFHTHHLSSLLTADLFYHQHSTSDDYLITIDHIQFFLNQLQFFYFAIVSRPIGVWIIRSCLRRFFFSFSAFSVARHKVLISFNLLNNWAQHPTCF